MCILLLNVKWQPQRITNVEIRANTVWGVKIQYFPPIILAPKLLTNKDFSSQYPQIFFSAGSCPYLRTWWMKQSSSETGYKWGQQRCETAQVFRKSSANCQWDVIPGASGQYTVQYYVCIVTQIKMLRILYEKYI